MKTSGAQRILSVQPSITYIKGVRMKILLICMSLSLALLCGCGILSKEPYRPVNYYDLDCKAAVNEALNIRIDEVSSVRPYSEKMVFRISGNRLEIDEFNRWADSPAELVRKYFTLAFQKKSPEAPALELKAEILQFEADLENRSVKIVIQAAVSGQKTVSDRIYSQNVALEKVTGENFARGVETALSKIVEEISKDVAGKK